MYERIAALEEENKRLTQQMEAKSQETKGLSNSIAALQEEISFLKSKTQSCLKELNDIHKRDKEKLYQQIRDLEAKSKDNQEGKDELPSFGEDQTMKIQENQLLKQKITEYEKQISYLNQSFSTQVVDASNMDKYKEHLSKLKSELDKTIAEKNKVQNENDALKQVD